jgi:hypothetical protein
MTAQILPVTTDWKIRRSALRCRIFARTYPISAKVRSVNIVARINLLACTIKSKGMNGKKPIPTNAINVAKASLRAEALSSSS